ncbi:TetR family transcriptional regulator [Pseudomonas sp. LFM046]|uniref:TetR/AcrR family transcriptional regulator n=1 Tax=Pseudomonas sp. LFM046 TaxID=1608357 RepID=UPI0005CF996A|nr:TetR family transcriptional regulator [Pseudomonas sp. LFM046]
MGRSSQQQASENRAKIVETASRMFRELGVENVSVSDVMAANGMTVGGFYKQFKSKDALVAEAFSLAFDQSLDAWDDVYQQADAKAENRACALVRQYLRNRSAKRRCPVLAFAPHVIHGGADEASVDAYKAGTKDLFDKFISELKGPTAAHTVSDAAERDAMVIFAAMVGARAIAQAIGNEPWVEAIEAAVNQAANEQGHR